MKPVIEMAREVLLLDELLSLIESWAIKHTNLSRYWKIVGKSRECRLTIDDLSTTEAHQPNNEMKGGAA